MAVEANTYGTETGVELLIGDVVASGDFTGSTDPTTTDVEKQLDAVAHDRSVERSRRQTTRSGGRASRRPG